MGCEALTQPVDFLQRSGSLGRGTAGDGTFGEEAIPEESDQKRNRR